MRRPTFGHTLVELLIVVSLLGLIAAVASQHASTSAAGQLEAAAGEVAGAIRFARIEAMRTRTMYGVDFSADAASGERRIRVFRVDAAVPPNAVHDVRHPITKSLFDIGLSSQPGTTGAAITQASFFFRASGPAEMREWVAFDSTGTPDYYPDAAVYATHEDATSINAVTVSQAQGTRRVRVDTVTGRVTVE